MNIDTTPFSANWRPDWRKEEPYAKYGDAKGSVVDLAWQFLRRSPHYQKDWQERMGKFFIQYGDTMGIDIEAAEAEGWEGLCPWPLDNDFPARRFIREKYGLLSVIAPPHLEDGSRLQFTRNQFVVYSPPLGFDGYRYERIVRLFPQEVIVAFDLSVPLGPQLNNLEANLTSLAKQKGYEVSDHSRIYRSVYPPYLRVLDALEEGASTKEIAEYVFPNKDRTYSGDSSGLNSVRDAKIKGKELMDGGYIRLINK